MKDLIIIGAGPIGLACGIEAKKNNLDYEIIDKGMLVNSIFNYPFNTNRIGKVMYARTGSSGFFAGIHFGIFFNFLIAFKS